MNKMKLDMTVTPIAVTSDEGRIIYRNASAKKLLPDLRKGTLIMRYFDVSEEPDALYIMEALFTNCKIIKFCNPDSPCRTAVAGVFSDGAKRFIAFIFPALLQRKTKDIFLENAEAASLLCADRLISFIAGQGELKDIHIPAGAWNFTRRNTTVYGIADGIGNITENAPADASKLLGNIRILFTDYFSKFGFHLSINVICPNAYIIPSRDIASALSALLHISILAFKSSVGGCRITVECTDGRINIRTRFEAENIGRVKSSTNTLTALAAALDYDDIPGMILADTILQDSGITLSCKPEGRSKKEAGNLNIALNIPVAKAYETVLHSPAAEEKLMSDFISAFAEMLYCICGDSGDL